MKLLCSADDLIPNAGVCALIDDEQVALFYLPGTEKKVFAVSNYDPLGKANVISRGIVGSIGDQVVVASPLYKQHFDIATGECLEQDGVALKTYPVELVNDQVMVA